MVSEIFLSLTWFFLLVQCDHGISEQFPSTINSSFLPLPPNSDFVTWDGEDSRDFHWDEEDVNLLRGMGQNPSGPVVTTDCGAYRGLYGGNKKVCSYESFKGIQYAQPPEGPNRFQNARPSDCDPSQQYEATEFCAPCMQPKGYALESSRRLPSEDCLCLNIYRPRDCKEKDEKPVLFYIYESYFLYGSASQPELNGGILACLGDIIVVTLNYRLGAFGWLYSGDDDDIPGNMGYSDIIVALEFIRDNIGFFGGDSKAVTIGGHGAGAIIAASFMFNRRVSDNLFQGVMCMSPNFNPQSYYDSYFITLLKSNEFLRCIGCDDGSDQSTTCKNQGFTEDEKACVKSTDGDTVAEASDQISFYDGNGICSRFQLMLAYKLISVDDLLQKCMFFKDKYIYIGALNTEYKKSLIGSKAKTKDEGANIIVDKIKPIIEDTKKKNIQEIIDYYLGFIGKDDAFAVGQRTTLALNMVCYGCLTVELIEYLSPFNEVYGYQYSYVASSDKDDPKRIYGAYHLDDVPFGFGKPFRAWKQYSDYDREVSRTLIGIWSDFVYQSKMKWPKFDEKDRSLAMIKGAEKDNYYLPNPYLDICERLDA